MASEVVLGALTLLPDCLAMYLRVPKECDAARVLLWTSWTWMLVNNRYFRINRVAESDQATFVRQKRSPVKRVLFTFGLVFVALGLSFADFSLVTVLHHDIDALALPPNVTMAARWKAAPAVWHARIATTHSFHWTVPLTLIVNHVFWDLMERHMLKMRRKDENSISRFIANSDHRSTKRALEIYTFGACVLLTYFEGLVCGLVFGLGCVLLVVVKTESLRSDEDEMQTAWHCSGFILVLLVAVYVLTKGHELLWVVKFSSVFPYFFMFITSISAHGMLKMRSEIKMFKHLFDAMAVLFVRM